MPSIGLALLSSSKTECLTFRRYPDDDYNRIWYPVSTPGLTSVAANFTELTNNCPDDPPSSVILHGVQSADARTAILLPFDFPETSRINYVALYFTELIQISADKKRSFNINIDGQDYGPTLTPQYKVCNEVNGTTNPATGVMNVTISPVDDSTLPPLISAVEVYTVSPMLVQGTNQDDSMYLLFPRSCKYYFFTVTHLQISRLLQTNQDMHGHIIV